MEKSIRAAYNEDILAEALSRFGIDPGSVQELDGFESFIYEYEKGGAGYILRVSHSAHRTPDMIAGEIDWINYLADGGVPAARAVPSAGGRWVETIPVDGGACFSAVSFVRAKGRPPRKQDWSPDFVKKMGQLMGKMHVLTKHYQPSNPAFRRPHWSEEADGFAEKYLPPSETAIIDKANTLTGYLRSLPRDENAYGLVHTDVHGGNFFVHEGEITLFDFDDCLYAWFVYDIAMALFYVLPHDCVGEENLNFARTFFEQFMEGYRTENALDPAWLKQIPHFLKLREIDLYVAIHRSLDLDDLDPWCQSFMDRRKYKIEHDVPYVDLDFGTALE